jgi:hypothetical protein
MTNKFHTTHQYFYYIYEKIKSRSEYNSSGMILLCIITFELYESFFIGATSHCIHGVFNDYKYSLPLDLLHFWKPRLFFTLVFMYCPRGMWFFSHNKVMALHTCVRYTFGLNHYNVQYVMFIVVYIALKFGLCTYYALLVTIKFFFPFMFSYGFQSFFIIYVNIKFDLN